MFRKALLPYLALATGIMALSFSALFVRWAEAPAPVMGMYRIGIATLVLTPVFLHRSRFGTTPPSSIKGVWSVLIWPILGGICSAADHFIWNTSLQYTSAANSTLLGNTAPLWVALVAWLFFRERLSRLFWVGLAGTMGGAAFVLGSDFLRHPTIGWGDALALLSGICYAGYYVMTERGRRNLDTLSYVWAASLSASLTLLGISLATRAPLTGYSLQTYLVFLAAALLPQVTGYLAIGYALGKLPASVVSPTMLGQPVLTALLAIPLLGENLEPVQWLGGLIVLGGIYLVHRGRPASASEERAIQNNSISTAQLT